MTHKKTWGGALGSALLLALLSGCTQETQNQIGRSVQNWTGTNGVLDVYAGDRLTMRFIGIDKLSTAYGTNEDIVRPYRFGYGTVDKNLNFTADAGEKKVYFEVSANATNYVFYENYED
jgi:hypothetical protein